MVSYHHGLSQKQNSQHIVLPFKNITPSSLWSAINRLRKRSFLIPKSVVADINDLTSNKEWRDQSEHTCGCSATYGMYSRRDVAH